MRPNGPAFADREDCAESNDSILNNPRAKPDDSRLDPGSEICVTSSGTEALFACCQAFLDPNDACVLLCPCFPWYFPHVRLAGARPISLTLQPPGFSLLDRKTRAELESVLKREGRRCKMIILNSPHNPTGHVMTREEFQLVACLLTQYCPNAVLVSVRWDARFDFVSAR